jgi:hypothetical protein
MIKNSDKQLGLYSGGLIFGIRWALVHVVGLYTGGGVGLYSEVYLVVILSLIVSVLKFTCVYWHEYDICDPKIFPQLHICL